MKKFVWSLKYLDRTLVLPNYSAFKKTLFQWNEVHCIFFLHVKGDTLLARGLFLFRASCGRYLEKRNSSHDRKVADDGELEQVPQQRQMNLKNHLGLGP